MSDSSTFEFITRTPHDVVVQMWVESLRVPTETGHIGLRPRMEPTLIAVEAGVVILLTQTLIEHFVGTAGGLLTSDGGTALLLTPLAVAGDDEHQINAELADALQRPNSDIEARVTLSKLEAHLLSELRSEQKDQLAQRFDDTVS